MNPRPILLVREPLYDDVRLHKTTAAVLEREGYLVLHCPSVAWDSMKVLAPCPFTRADVVALRAIADGERTRNGPDIEDAYELDSIAARIEGMLLVEGVLAGSTTDSTTGAETPPHDRG
jgi:hypothetical protein